jgi:ERCC4-related helicase
MRYVHIPQLSRVMHPVGAISDSKSGILSALKHAYASYDLNQDPYVLDLFRQHEQGYDVLKAIQKVSVSGKTYCRDHLRSLVTKAEAMSEELGSSSMEWYLSQCIARFAHMVQMSHFQLFEWSADERSHLLKILTALPTVDNDVCKVAPLSLEQISRKVDLLVDLLISEAKDDPYFTCLVFVEQRVWVACIAEILAQHPGTKDLLRVGTFVGTSQDSKRKANLATLAEPRNQQTTLDNFRSGALNLILATSVLEEGIDVSSCHLVICFERPKNLKSFVQRRGRARKEGSKYVIFMPETGGGRHPDSWQSLEEEMKTAYLDDLRKAKVAQEKELQDEDGHRFFEVPSTG